jgi:hypothetical protein
MVVLRVNPWDVATLTAMATSYKNLADTGEGPAYSRFAESSLFCLKCAADARQYCLEADALADAATAEQWTK